MKKRTNRPEEVLHRHVVQYLSVVLTEETAWFHVPNGGGRSKAEAGILKAMGVKAGVADLILVYCGQHFELELKPPGRYASPNQKEWQAVIEAAGGRYGIARSIEDVREALRAWGIPTRERFY